MAKTKEQKAADKEAKAKAKAEKEVVTEKVEAVEVAEEQKAEPQFINNGKDVKIRLDEGKTFKWITVRNGQTVTIPRKIALANGLTKVK